MQDLSSLRRRGGDNSPHIEMGSEGDAPPLGGEEIVVVESVAEMPVTRPQTWCDWLASFTLSHNVRVGMLTGAAVGGAVGAMLVKSAVSNEATEETAQAEEAGLESDSGVECAAAVVAGSAAGAAIGGVIYPCYKGVERWINNAIVSMSVRTLCGRIVTQLMPKTPTGRSREQLPAQASLDDNKRPNE